MVVGNQYTSLLSQDDWYDGYFIPKGTICLANIWYYLKFAFLYPKKPDYLSRTINRDPAIYVGSNTMSAGNPLVFYFILGT